MGTSWLCREKVFSNHCTKLSSSICPLSETGCIQPAGSLLFCPSTPQILPDSSQFHRPNFSSSVALCHHAAAAHAETSHPSLQVWRGTMSLVAFEHSLECQCFRKHCYQSATPLLNGLDDQVGHVVMPTSSFVSPTPFLVACEVISFFPSVRVVDTPAPGLISRSLSVGSGTWCISDATSAFIPCSLTIYCYLFHFW